MPVAVKPLFRPEALHKKLAVFQVPPKAAAARDNLVRWAEFLATPAAETTKETELLPKFLGDVFRDVLGYTGPADGVNTYTLKEQPTVEVDGKFADAALGRFPLNDGPPRYLVAVEGKGPTDPLDRPYKNRKKSAVDQALGYAVNFPCDWYLVTNLREIRLYHKGHDQFTYERFLTSALAADGAAFRRFVFLLGAVRVAPADGPGHLDELLKASRESGKKLTDELYAVYADLRRQAFETLRAANPDRPPEAVLTATQKILDRVLFICFCEDRELLPADSIRHAFRHRDEYEDRPIWSNFKTLFRWIDRGNAARQIEPYNGGLFAKNEFIDSLVVPDAVCRGFDTLAAYEYGKPTAEDTDKPPVDVEILGHIFEQSISDLEELHRAIQASGGR
ncbi:MAG TPA: hypothetical protein VKD90_29460, partial [Gemmataceae bacterium]|nr:hypothetical protein [Gemmataceae bacterium]